MQSGIAGERRCLTVKCTLKHMIVCTALTLLYSQIDPFVQISLELYMLVGTHEILQQHRQREAVQVVPTRVQAWLLRRYGSLSQQACHVNERVSQ